MTDDGVFARMERRWFIRYGTPRPTTAFEWYDFYVGQGMSEHNIRVQMGDEAVDGVLRSREVSGLPARMEGDLT